MSEVRLGLTSSENAAAFLRKPPMETITFYSYKGGAGRSLALANAARYLARLEFKVVALDFDLEAPGLHYKFSSNSDGKPLPVVLGVVDYLHRFIIEGQTQASLDEFAIDVAVPGSEKPLIQLIAAGGGPSKEYWKKLSRIDWHELFYSKGAKGVQVFLELKNRIADELKPDFLLIDSRTGITEMGGVATTLLADKVICLVLPSKENLEGARAVLRSLRRARREGGIGDLEVMIALSRLPRMKDSEVEQNWINLIRTTLNEEAEDLRDTLTCSEVFVLHSDAALETREALRVGSGVSPDDSLLLRDYLRLFANVVPRELIAPRVESLILQAKERIWADPEGALKEVEELAESFGHPENYRALLRFYEVRNVTGGAFLKKAQRLWELTRDSKDPTLWQGLLRAFDPKPRWQREKEWSPSLEFVESVWRHAGNRDTKFGIKLATAYSHEDLESRAADVLLEVLDNSEPTTDLVSRCIVFLDAAKRASDATKLIKRLRPQFAHDTEFVEAWARHVLRDPSRDALAELIHGPEWELLGTIRPLIAASVFFKAGMLEEASALGDKALQDIRQRGPSSHSDLMELGEFFEEIGRWEQFKASLEDHFPSHILRDVQERIEMRRRRR